MQLSVKNRWLDSEGKVYIYFSQEQIAGLMGCGVKKVRCLLKELDDRKGIGLQESGRDWEIPIESM